MRRDAARAARPTRPRVPVVTLSCSTAAVAIVLVVLVVPIPAPDPDGSWHLAGLWVFAPPVLGLIGAAAALLDRGLAPVVRLPWAVVSAASGLLAVWGYFMLGTLLWGP
jgi:hypothetical protein